MNSTTRRQWLGFALLATGMAAGSVLLLALLLLRGPCGCGL